MLTRITLLILTLFITIGLGLNAQTSKGYQIGDQVKNFSLKNVDGDMVSMSDYKDAKGIILIITCNTCPWAKKYEDRIEALHAQYEPKGFPVIAINSNDVNKSPGDSYAAMQQRADEKGFSFPYVYDETQEIARALGATRTPEVFLVENTREGFILRYHGAIDDNPKDPNSVDEKFVEQAVNAVIEGKEIDKPETKFIGCSVKYAES